MKDSTDVQFLDYLTAIIAADGRNPAPARIDKALQRMAVFPISTAAFFFPSSICKTALVEHNVFFKSRFRIFLVKSQHFDHPQHRQAESPWMRRGPEA